MRYQKIRFADHEVLCVFPDERTNLAKAATELRLEGSYPVIVLIGGDIDTQHAEVTQLAIQTLARIAENIHAVMICGGTDMGVMAEIGRARQQNHHKFPLIGIAPEELVSWPGGPHSTKFLWWGKKRWHLAPYYSHFMLVPGSQFGDESPWILDTASLLSKGRKAVTMLINGGEVSRTDIQLSLAIGRPVIVLSRTGRLADELASQPDRDGLITIVSGNMEQQIVDTVQTALSVKEIRIPSQAFISMT
jgi:hypothetical protein